MTASNSAPPQRAGDLHHQTHQHHLQHNQHRARILPPRYQDICRGLPASPTTSTILNAATTIMAEISTSIQQVVVGMRIRIKIDRIRINCNLQSGECGRSSWNSSHDPRWVNGSYHICYHNFKSKRLLQGFQQY